MVPQVRSRGALAAAVAGAAIAVVLLPNAPAGVPVMASAVAALPLLLRGRPK
jgi:predicted branched-subunit amino acid permease